MSKHKHGPPATHGPARNAAPGGPPRDAGHGHGHDAAGGHGHARSSHGPTTGTFITIWLILAFLTVVEVAVPQVYSSPWDQHIKMLLLCSLAIGKALLVALFFMHLKWETPWLKRIALLPAYMGVAAVLLMIETAWRNSLS